MEDKLEIDFQEPLIGLLVMNLQDLQWHVEQKKIGSQSSISNLLSQLESYETETQLNQIKNNWSLLKTNLEEAINNFTKEVGWSKNLIQAFLISDAIFDLLTTNNSLLSELKINLETQNIQDYQKLIILMKKIAVKKMHQNYILLQKMWTPIDTPQEFRRLIQVSLNLDSYADFIESQRLMWELLTVESKLPQTVKHWRYLSSLMNNEAITNFIDFFESNLEAIDEDSHLSPLKPF